MFYHFFRNGFNCPTSLHVSLKHCPVIFCSFSLWSKWLLGVLCSILLFYFWNVQTSTIYLKPVSHKNHKLDQTIDIPFIDWLLINTFRHSPLSELIRIFQMNTCSLVIILRCLVHCYELLYQGSIKSPPWMFLEAVVFTLCHIVIWSDRSAIR